MPSFHERKQARAQYFELFVKGWKSQPCVACSGSGRYDSTNSPKCGACGGSGSVKVPPQKVTTT